MSVQSTDLETQLLVDVYAAYVPRVRVLARRRLADGHLVEDAVQETFLRAFRAWDRFDTSRPVWPWLQKIADGVCTDALRRTARRREHPLPPHLAVVDTRHGGREPHREMEARVRSRAVADTLRSLPERQRRVLEEHALGARSYAEIAEQEGLTTDAVKSLSARARRSFVLHYRKLAGEGAFGSWVVRLRRRTWSARAAVAAPWFPLAEAVGAVSVAGVLLFAGGGVPAPPDLTDGRDAPPEIAVATVAEPVGHAELLRVRTEPAVRRLASVSVGSDALAGAGVDGARMDTVAEHDDNSLVARVIARLPGAHADVPAGMDIHCDRSAARRAVCGAYDRLP